MMCNKALADPKAAYGMAKSQAIVGDVLTAMEGGEFLDIAT
jgi:hypothetical protein